MFSSPNNEIIASPAGGSGSASNGCGCRGQQLNYVSGSGETPGSFSCPATDWLPNLGQGRQGPVPEGSCAQISSLGTYRPWSVIWLPEGHNGFVPDTSQSMRHLMF